MRVEVYNGVDAALMVSAMTEAVRAFQNAMGTKFVGLSKAVISFKGIGENGQVIDLFAEDGSDYVISLDRNRIANAELEEKRAKEEKYFAERRERMEHLNYIYYMLNHVTKVLCKELGVIFLDYMNEIVEDVWKEYKPVQQRGKDKGKLKPTPYFGVEHDGLKYIYSDRNLMNRKRPMRNPFYGPPNYAGFPARWKSKEWSEVSVRILKMMKHHAKELVPDGKVKDDFMKFELDSCPTFV